MDDSPTQFTLYCRSAVFNEHNYINIIFFVVVKCRMSCSSGQVVKKTPQCLWLVCFKMFVMFVIQCFVRFTLSLNFILLVFAHIPAFYQSIAKQFVLKCTAHTVKLLIHAISSFLTFTIYRGHFKISLVLAIQWKQDYG
jgi:hypothetical protein